MFTSKTKFIQLIVTLAACAFLFVPMVLSVMAGVTANYFQGISSGLTFKWVFRVWELYADSIFLSLWLAIACLISTLIIGLQQPMDWRATPAGYPVFSKSSYHCHSQYRDLH